MSMFGFAFDLCYIRGGKGLVFEVGLFLHVSVRYIKYTTTDTFPHQPQLSLPFRSVAPEGPEQETQLREFTELFT